MAPPHLSFFYLTKKKKTKNKRVHFIIKVLFLKSNDVHSTTLFKIFNNVGIKSNFKLVIFNLKYKINPFQIGKKNRNTIVKGYIHPKGFVI